MLDAFHVDCIELGRGYNQDEADWRPWRLPDGTPCLVPHWIDPQIEGDRWVISARDGRPIAIQKAGMVYCELVFGPHSTLSSLPASWRRASIWPV